MLPPHDQLPPPIRPRIERTSLLRDLVLLAGLVLAVFAGTAMVRQSMEPSVVSGTSALTVAERSVAAASPFVIVFPDTLVMVTHTPIPKPSTPESHYTPLPDPIDICITTTPKGEVCEQPLPPLPTNTPIAACPVSPGELCVWDGGPVTWLSPTPSSERSLTVGASN